MYGIILQITQNLTTAIDSVQAVTPTAIKSITLWDMAEKGGPILIPIAALSVIALYIFFERLFTVRRFSKIDMNFMHQIRDYVHNGNIEAARMLCRNTKSPVARMIEKGIMRLGKPVREIEVAIENVGKLEIYKMEKNMNILATIAGIAPMFGFLGTIFGEPSPMMQGCIGTLHRLTVGLNDGPVRLGVCRKFSGPSFFVRYRPG